MNGDQNLFRTHKYHDNWNHAYCAYESSSVVKNSTVDSHSFLVTLWISFVLACSETLADKSFQCSIETLNNGKSQDIDEHVAHSNSSDKNWLISMSNEVGVDQLNKHVEKHADDWSNTKRHD